MVDIRDIMIVIENRDYSQRHYYDCPEDRVILLSEFFESEGDREVNEAIEAGDSRYLYVEPYDFLGQEAMQRYIRGLDDDVLSERPLDAINRRGAFRNFRDIVEDAGLLSEWCGFREAYVEARAREWCEAEGVPVDGD